MIADPRERALDLLRRHAWNVTAFQGLEAGLDYFFDGAGEDEACVAYVDTGGAWVAAGAPLCPEARLGEVAERFIAAARSAGRRACFFAAEDRFVAAAKLEALPIGEQPTWDPRRWEDSLRESRSLREQIRRARAKGVVVRRLAPDEIASGRPERTAIDALIARWLRSRALAPMGFLVKVDPFSFAAERRYHIAEKDGQIIGFLAAIPVYRRNGWFLEDLLRDPRAPNGTAELLVDAAMRTAAAEGSTYATLGLAPLAGEVAGWMRFVRKLASLAYDFDGVKAFKTKLRPSGWDPIYLAVPRGRSGLAAIYDSLAAFAQGGFLRFGLATLLRGPAIVVRLLAILLVPWTLLLASPWATPYFPEAWIKWGWVAFDATLVGPLVALRLRWRRRVGPCVAAAVTADAVVTVVEAMAWNVSRVARARDVVAIVLAILAPTLAAFVLWRARAHRSGVG